MSSIRMAQAVLIGGFILLFASTVTSYGLCGDKLVKMIMDICDGCVVKPRDRFVIPKRSFVPLLEPTSWEDLRPPLLKRQGLSDKCCTGTCSFNDLQSYCETDRNKCKPIRNGSG